MLRIYELLREMAESLVWYRSSADELRHEEGEQDRWKKMALTVPYGLDFATWRSLERRRLERLATMATQD